MFLKAVDCRLLVGKVEKSLLGAVAVAAESTFSGLGWAFWQVSGRRHILTPAMCRFALWIRYVSSKSHANLCPNVAHSHIRPPGLQGRDPSTACSQRGEELQVQKDPPSARTSLSGHVNPSGQGLALKQRHSVQHGPWRDVVLAAASLRRSAGSRV